MEVEREARTQTLGLRVQWLPPSQASRLNHSWFRCHPQALPFEGKPMLTGFVMRLNPSEGV